MCPDRRSGSAEWRSPRELREMAAECAEASDEPRRETASENGHATAVEHGKRSRGRSRPKPEPSEQPARGLVPWQFAARRASMGRRRTGASVGSPAVGFLRTPDWTWLSDPTPTLKALEEGVHVQEGEAVRERCARERALVYLSLVARRARREGAQGAAVLCPEEGAGRAAPPPWRGDRRTLPRARRDGGHALGVARQVPHGR